MTGSLRDSCNELGIVLSQISAKCDVIVGNLHRFDSYVSSYALEELTYTLVLILLLVIVESSSLQMAHEGRGYIRIFVSIKEGITVCRFERPGLGQDRSLWRTSGYTVLSLDEFKDMLTGMIEEKDWAKSVQWLNDYGRFLNKYDDSTLGWRIP
jgi:hypothetical protein